jgi:hypothetical protein
MLAKGLFEVRAMRLRYQRMESWPALAWLAHGRRGDNVVDVTHGARVEIAPDWFCEAVWDGSYEDGGFDRTDIVFGSGGRSRDGIVTFVSSGATVDRLQLLESGDDVWVSNSLPCLLAAAGSNLDPAYPHYFRDFSSIRQGLSRYTPLLATSAGAARLIYFNNLTWDGKQLQQVAKPLPLRDFGTFERYRGFLETSLQRIAANLAAPARRLPFRLLGTISSGYDSPTIATLARSAGLREVISFDRSREAESDSGQEIAARLGLAVTVVARDAWQAAPLAEIPFLAADAKGEDVYFKSAEASLTGSVLLTGFHGDKMWGKYTTALSPDLVRGDQSGLSLTEYRLHAGFIHFPVPFMGVRQIRDVNRISRSPAMSRWDVPGDYTRPICRRIVEEAGVPRELFGVSKKAASVLFFHGTSFLTPTALAEYLPWLESHAEVWRLAGRTPPARPARGRRQAVLAGVARAAQYVERVAHSRGPTKLIAKAARRVVGWAEREPLFRWVFPWAAQRARVSYAPE